MLQQLLHILFKRSLLSIFLTVFALNVISLNTLAEIKCSLLFLSPQISSNDMLMTRNRVFKTRGIRSFSANSFYVHQVLGAKSSSLFFENQWLLWFSKLLRSAQKTSSISLFEEAWLKTSYQNLIWTTKGRPYMTENKNAIQVTLSFKENYVFIDSYDINKFTDPQKAMKSYFIAGLFDKANNFYKITSLQGLEKVVLFDPKTGVTSEYKF